jgi:hypothetical protein
MTERTAVAKQWLGKHVTIPDPLQGNGPINTFLDNEPVKLQLR